MLNKTLIFLLSILVFASCTKKKDSTETQPTLPSNPPSRISSVEKPTNPKIPQATQSLNISTFQNFFITLKKAVLDKDQVLLMKTIDPEYKKEQHQKMLKGRTNQFINELFCGNLNPGQGFRCLKFKKITGITMVSSKRKNSGNYDVEFEISGDGIKIICNWVVKVRVLEGKKFFGLVGAVG
jgi:hypothetical protein